ncbi:MAG: 30S ribosomal protein S20 [bacterium]|nr:30S ribosomal protein S20 [bacterium]
MASSFSAKKRIKQNEEHRARNRARKSELKSEIRKFTDALHDKDQQAAQKQYVVVVKKLDQTAAKGTLHKNAAARTKSRLARRLNQLTAVAQ